MAKSKSAGLQKDQLYPVVTRCVSQILETSQVVTPVDVLLKLQRITKKQYEDWRFGRIPYLERVAVGNLGKLNRILRILDLYAKSIGLKPSHTEYRKWGKNGKHIALRFSKSGEPAIEAAYSRHYVSQRPAFKEVQPPAEGDVVDSPMRGVAAHATE